MSDGTTVIWFRGGRLNGQQYEIKGNPRIFELPIRSSPAMGSVRVGTITYERSDDDNRIYKFVDESGWPDTH